MILLSSCKKFRQPQVFLTNCLRPCSISYGAYFQWGNWKGATQILGNVSESSS